MQEAKADKGEQVLLVLLCIIPILIFCTVIHFAGPQWDITVRALSGHAMVNFFTHHVNLQTAFGGEAYYGSDNLLYYFEPYREPLSTLIFALLSLVSDHTVLPYLILLYLFYLFAVYKLSKELGLKYLVAFSIMLNSYVVYFLFVPNGGEGLSIILVLMGLVYLLRKRPGSGLFFGLASLAKYPSIILFPLVLLLGDRKKIAEALALEAAMVALWGVIDYVIYGIPFYSYLESIGSSGIVSGASVISLSAMLQVFGYPLLFLSIGVAVIFYLNKSKLKIGLDYKGKVILGMILLSGICYLIIVPHNDPFTQARYGYLISVALLIAAALVMEAAVEKKEKLKYLISLLAILLLAYALYNTYVSLNNPSGIYYNSNNLESIYVHAGTVIGGLGFGECRFISNAWVPMIYAGYDSYSPFILYNSNGTTFIVNQTLGKLGIPTKGWIDDIMKQYFAHNVTYAAQEARYPILIFDHTGVPISTVPGLNHTRQVYSDQNMSVYLPANATCYQK